MCYLPPASVSEQSDLETKNMGGGEKPPYQWLWIPFYLVVALISTSTPYQHF